MTSPPGGTRHKLCCAAAAGVQQVTPTGRYRPSSLWPDPLQASITGTRRQDAPAPSWIATPRIKRRAMSAVCSAPRSVGE